MWRSSNWSRIPPIADEDWFTAAIHEAGHAVARVRLDLSFDYVTIFRRGNAVLGHVAIPAGPCDPIKRSIACMAGPLAECRHTGVPLDALCQDVARTDHAMAEDALSRLRDPPPLAAIIVRAERLVSVEWRRIGLVAEALVQRRRLDYAEVVRLIRGT